jgi:cytoskeletal protein CcmA (bactofilin family)
MENERMLRMKKRKQPAIGTLIGAGTRVHGDIEFSGGIHVDGYVKGNVEAVGDAASSISVSERGCVEGTVSVAHVLLNGTVNGDVLAADRVELGPRARVIGNVRYALIEMAVGAEVNGKLIHESERPAGKRLDEQSESLEPVNAVGE